MASQPSRFVISAPQTVQIFPCHSSAKSCEGGVWDAGDGVRLSRGRGDEGGRCSPFRTLIWARKASLPTRLLDSLPLFVGLFRILCGCGTPRITALAGLGGVRLGMGAAIGVDVWARVDHRSTVFRGVGAREQDE